MGTKIATCCYCGTRAALRLGGKVQHELACSSCGAPLHELKQMPIEPRRVEKQKHYDKPRSNSKPLKKNKYYKKKKKSWSKQLFDGIEDIIDIFD